MEGGKENSPRGFKLGSDVNIFDNFRAWYWDRFTMEPTEEERQNWLMANSPPSDLQPDLEKIARIASRITMEDITRTINRP